MALFAPFNFKLNNREHALFNKKLNRGFFMAVDMAQIVGRTRRLIFDRDSSNYIRTDAELHLYIRDAIDHINMDYFDFTDFTVTGTSISPTPDTIDAQLIAIRTALNITHEDIREASGDAILIQTGDIKLDTSKSPPNLKTNLEFLESQYDKMITSLNMDGKSDSSSATGIRVDTYIEDAHSSETGESLL